jgi:hypothetical protein
VYFADNLGLLSLEKKILENMHKDFNVSAKAVDDDDIKLNYKSLRGNGGNFEFPFALCIFIDPMIVVCIFCFAMQLLLHGRLLKKAPCPFVAMAV